MKYPAWFPYPSSWLKAFILGLLLRAFGVVLEATGSFSVDLLQVLARSRNPALLIFLMVMITLSPIPLIAVAHKLFHELLDRYIPSIQSPLVKQSPYLMSLWEGLYGWTVSFVATCCVIGVLCILSPFAQDSVGGVSRLEVETTLGVIWLVFAAYLYQIEYLVEHLLIATNSTAATASTPAPKPSPTPPPQSSVTQDVNALKAEMGLLKMKRPKPPDSLK